MLALLIPGVGMGGGVAEVEQGVQYCIAAKSTYVLGARTRATYNAGDEAKATYKPGAQQQDAGCC